MIPIRDDNPTRTFSFVTLAFIAANVTVFVHELRLPETRIEAFINEFGFVPAVLTYGQKPADFVGVFTSMFLHGGWSHIIGNMLFLWIFGNNIEDAVGHGKFIVFYLLSGVAAAGAQFAMDPQSTVPMIGASGAVSGVLGAYLLLYPRARVTVLIPIWIFFKFVEVPAVMMLIIWFGLQLLSGLFTPPGHAGVAFWAHIGGFVAGLVLILFFKKQRIRLFGG
jgi:membrane associated rhomboid family serine protease